MKLRLTLPIIFISICSYAQVQSDTLLIKEHMLNLTQTREFRNYKNVETLDTIAEYIFNEFSKYCDTVFYQSYTAYDKVYKNVIGRFNSDSTAKLIIGAHYDVCGEQQGADDNATGVTGLLELARLFAQDSTLTKHIELVAYTLEEPPFFRSLLMGSTIHANSLAEENQAIEGMICLEMIGYFDDAKKSQDYPLNFLKMFYGNRGDFITVVEKFGPGKFARKFGKKMKKQKIVETKIFRGPGSLQGIDFSDHLNYWALNYSAVMITDTAFYRNKNYHTPEDTLEKLNLYKMGLVIDEVYRSVKEL